MDDAVVGELEAAVADVGALLVRARKYRRRDGIETAPLLAEALALGDRARGLHRHGALDAAAARRLLGEAHALAARVHAVISAAHAAPAYRAAVAAFAAGDRAALAAAVPAVFADLEAVPTPPALFYPLAWQRRGRPRRVADVVADVARCRDAGIDAEGDDVVAGTDPDLPAVVLAGDVAGDEPVTLRFGAGTVGEPVYRIADTGEFLVYVPRLRAPFTVVLRRTLEAEDDEGAADFPAWRAALAAALTTAGIAIDDA